ncbi:uncharacterized protein FA14DRAFT_122835 [Meira miltonrushii]|uniref:NADH dehydrogenase [ubiquinone] iron-sulfur protein 4, mitochondrial n=1 Tax=Meira miltonrushii TaxID=1280837 RepID=A0A316VBP4_9BASI|nr:uncharacterized protein FA14DRAFT_122835 [Meira miltonrushii]PWN35049.1 hypothetical protein FA14DRAFT_122835 [Meira miltonrushii]
MFARTSLRSLVRSPISGSSSRTLSTSAILRDQQAPAQVGTGERNLIKEQEERDVQAVEAEIVNDAPAELQQRTVRIYKPAKTANSSGKAGTSFWRVDFDILSGSARWENPLMGWASSGDYMQGTFLKFRTREDAIHFCEKQNWPYYIQTPHKARIGPKSYAANYSYSPGKLRVHHTK